MMGCYIYRSMVACGFPFNDGDRGANHIDAALRVQRVGVGAWAVLPDGDGSGHLLRLLPHVQSACSLRESWSPPHPFPGTGR